MKPFVDGDADERALAAAVTRDLGDEGLLSTPLGWSLARVIGDVYASRAKSFLEPARAAVHACRRAARFAATNYAYARDGADVVLKSDAFKRAGDVAQAMVERYPVDAPPDPAAVFSFVASVSDEGASRGVLSATSEGHLQIKSSPRRSLSTRPFRRLIGRRASMVSECGLSGNAARCSDPRAFSQ